VHRLSQQFGGSPGDGQLGLQLGDPAAGGDQFMMVGGGHAGLQPVVDAVLPAPVVDRLIADLQVFGNLLDSPSGSQ
jgi:hypothetical protein